jgi:hypothetical protein
VALVGGGLEPPELDLVVERVPVGLVLGRPVLAGLDLAVDLLGDGLPGVADGAHLGGGGEQVFEVLRHDGLLLPRVKCAGVEEVGRGSGSRRPNGRTSL